MKKIIFIGAIGAGKTRVSDTLLGIDHNYRKTQSVEVRGANIIDTPGEYLEQRGMRNALTITSADAEIIAFVQAANEERVFFSPAYAGSFAKEVIGIVTKTDLATEKQIDYAADMLKLAGVKKIFRVSCVTENGIEELKKYLE